MKSHNSSNRKKNNNKYENTKNKDFNDILNDSLLSESNNDIMLNIDDEAKKLKTNIKEKDLKIFSKYEDLSEEQILKLIKEKNDNLIQLSDQKDKSKNILNKIIKNLNTTLSKNSDFLCKEESDPEVINELKKIIDSKKKALKISKSLNQTFKSQYNSMVSKMPNNNKNLKEKVNDNDTHIIELQNENKNLELEIRKYKDDEISKQKELEIIYEDKIYPAKIKMKADENQNLINQKHEYYNKINMSLNSIKNLIKEVEHLEKIYSEIKDKENDSEKIENKMIYWIEIIKNDLNGTEKEIISKVFKGQSKFLHTVDKKLNDEKELSYKMRSSSPNIKERRNINLSLKKIRNLNNIDIEETENNKFSGKKIINKGKNSRLIYSQNTEKTKNIIIPKGVFGKFSFLKQKPNTSESKISKTDKNINNIEEKLSEEKVDDIIQKDYNDTTDADYRQLLDKKTQYLETNSRLEENIKKIQRTINKKYDSINQIVQENSSRLELLKSRNELLQKEINNLKSVYQLTLEQEKIKYELKRQENEIKKDIQKSPGSVDISSATEKAILNELKESNDLPVKNKNKSGYRKEIIEHKINNETREEKLQKIKKKYKDMNEDSIDEIDFNEEKNE
jgi:hypothetical protein